jgi:NADH dehydrogenase
MILVTGGTGFVGRALIRQLVTMGKPVRTLLRPSTTSPNLPKGIPVEVAVCSLNDTRGLRAALKGVDVIYHLVSTERRGSRSDLPGTDIEGTENLANAAAQTGVERIFYLSHLSADRFSAFPLLKAKAIAEGYITHSGVDATIFRSAAIYGPRDQFTTSLASLIRLSPGLFFMPGDGSTLVQPIWIEDLITCMLLALDDDETRNQVFEVGGAEYFSFRQVVSSIMQTINVKRVLVPLGPAYLRMLALLVEQMMPRFPISMFWLDYLAADRTCPLDTLPRRFGLIPARFTQNLDYLKPKPRRLLRSTH